MATPWQTNTKEITILSGRAGKTTGNLPIFVPPNIPRPYELKFTPDALFAAMARTAALLRVSPAISTALRKSAKALCREIVDDTGTAFDIVKDVKDLVDFERSALAGRMGAGITDLCMNDLGYRWKDLASEHVHKQGRFQLGDFIYSGGPCGSNVVLTEAKGSLSLAANTAKSDVEKTARTGYSDQVEPHVGDNLTDKQLNPTGQRIVHGYAVAFGATPGGQVACIYIAETERPVPRGADPSAGGNMTSAALALGNYRAAFALATAPSVVAAIEWCMRMHATRPNQRQIFRRYRSGEPPDDRIFLVGTDESGQIPQSANAPWSLFGIDETIAEHFLDYLSKWLGNPQMPIAYGRVELPQCELKIAPPRSNYHVLFRDGQGLLGDLDLVPGYRIWSPTGGLGREQYWF